ncbi:MAG TPA: hypothetical protein VIZ43_28770 [Trebonia sp.]
MLDASRPQHPLLAETLGLAMARRAWDILERHRAALAGGGLVAGGPDTDVPVTGGPVTEGSVEVADDGEFAIDNAIFTAVLDAANECLGQFDPRPADDRWCDALLQLICLARLSSGDAPPYP